MADIARTTIEMQTPYEKWQIGEGIRSYRGFAVDLNIAEVDPCGSGTVGPRVLTPARRVPGSPPRSALRHPDEGPTFARLCGGIPTPPAGQRRMTLTGNFGLGLALGEGEADHSVILGHRRSSAVAIAREQIESAIRPFNHVAQPPETARKEALQGDDLARFLGMENKPVKGLTTQANQEQRTGPRPSRDK